MPRTLISLLALAVLLAVGGVWWLLGGDGPRAGGPDARPGAVDVDPEPTATLPGATTRPGDALPLDVSGLVPALPDAPGDDVVPGVLAASAWVRGRLVDPDGAPLAGEPLLLLLDRDPWAHTDSPHARQGGATRGDVLSAAVSDADGRFELAARAGTQHSLRAGGRRAAPQVLHGVRAGTELLLVLEPGAELRGRVISEETGEPVPLAHVGALTGAQHMITRADAEGAFRLAPLPDADHLYGAWAPGFGVLSGVLVPGDEELLLELPPARDVPGQVLERDTHLPVPNALVRLSLDIEARLAGSAGIEHEEHRVHEVETRTDDEGRFVFPDAPARSITLEVEAEGYVPVRYTAYENRELREDESAVVQLTPAEPHLVSVVDAETQQPLVGVAVELSAEGERIAEASSDEHGVAALPTTELPHYTSLHFHARDERGFSAYARTSLRRDETLLELVEPARLVLRTTLHGEPLPDAEVAVLSDAPPTLGRSGELGLVELLHERAGPGDELRVQARFESWQSLPVSVPWPPESDEPVELPLDGGVYVRGQVVDEFGAGLPAVRLWSSFAPGGHSGPEGFFELGPVEPDTNGRLYATADGYRRGSASDIWAGDDDVILALEPELQLRGRVLQAADFVPVDGYSGRLQKERLVNGVWEYGDTSERVRPDRSEPGAFTVTLAEAGRYRVRVKRPGSLEAFSAVVDHDGRTEPPELEVLLAPAAVLEVLVEDSRGAPVPGLKLTLVDWEQHLERREKRGKKQKARKPRTWSQRSDASGVATFQLGEGGRFALQLPQSDGEYGAPFYVWPGPAVSETLRLGPTGDLLVSVRDEAGRPVPSMRVRARSVNGSHTSRRESVRTAEDTLLIPTLLPDTYLLSVEARGFGTHQRKVTVIGDLTQTVDVVLGEGSRSGVRFDMSTRGRGGARNR